MVFNRSKRLALLTCLFAGPLFQLIGDILWKLQGYNYSWNIWRETGCVFFIPAGFLFAKLIERKSFAWAMISCGLFILGCVGCIAMMPLFRLSGFYQTQGHNEFPLIVQSVLDKKLFAVTLFPPGLCFPVSFVVFGIAFLKYKIFQPPVSIAFILCGIFFWLGNAGEIDAILIVGDVLMLCTCSYAGYLSLLNNSAYTLIQQRRA